MAIKQESIKNHCVLHMDFNEDDLRMKNLMTGEYGGYATVGRKYIEGFNGTGFAYEANTYTKYIRTYSEVPTTEFSIKMRIKILNTGRSLNFIVSSSNGYNQVGYPGFNFFYTSANKFYYQYYDGQEIKTALYLGEYKVDEWMDIMITKKGKELLFFINDMVNPIMRKAEDVETYQNSSNLVLFSTPQYFSSSAYYPMLHMDEFMLFKKAIEAEDIVDERFFVRDGSRVLDVITENLVVTEAPIAFADHKKLMPRIDDVFNRKNRELVVDLDKQITRVRKLEAVSAPANGGGLVYRVPIEKAFKKLQSPNNYA